MKPSKIDDTDWDDRLRRITATQWKVNLGPASPADTTASIDYSDDDSALAAMVRRGREPAGSKAPPGAFACMPPKYVPGGYKGPTGETLYYKVEPYRGRDLTEAEWCAGLPKFIEQQQEIKKQAAVELEKILKQNNML